jgi:hypothetical protein
MRGQGNSIGTSERGRFDHLSKRFVARFRRGRNPGISILLQSKLTPPVGSAIAPEEEGDKERIIGEGAEVNHKEAHNFRRNPEFESTLTKLRDFEVSSNTTNGGLKENPNGRGRKLKHAMTESSN